MSVYLGTQLLSGAGVNTVSNAHDLFDFKWVDHELTDQSWLKADTFSWQDGTVYSDAYDHLENDYSNGTLQSETIGSYTIDYILAPDGHKIVLANNETTVANIYAESGVSWYYVLDQANTRFKLPRTKYGFEGLRDTVGKYIAETLPNITGKMVRNSSIIGQKPLFNDVKNDLTGALKQITGTTSTALSTSNASAWRVVGFEFDASSSNATYQDSAPVQERATQMYLYFYVGEYSQSATEQTAGLNAELFNEKVDLDSSWGFPSHTYDELTLGASGTNYTAPENGWFVVCKGAGAADKYLLIVNNANSLSMETYPYAIGNNPSVYVPVKRGDSVKVSYNVSGPTQYFRFIYAQNTN